MAAGLGALIVAKALGVSAARRETCVAATGLVVGVAEAGQVTVVVEVPPFEPVQVTIPGSALPMGIQPVAGDTLPMLVPVRAPGRMFVAGAEPPLIQGGVRGPRGHRVVARWPVFAGVDDALEQGRRWLSHWALDRQRRYCARILDDLLRAPENLSLRTITGEHDYVVRRQALADQESIFDATAEVRRTAIGQVAKAVAAVAVALYLLIPVVEQVANGLTDVLVGGDVAEQWHWAEAVKASGLPRVDLYVILACAAVFAVAGVLFLRRTVGAAAAALTAWRAELRILVNQRLRAAYQKSINAVESPTLQVRTAPGLATAAADQLIERAEAARLRALAFDLGAGAIAISGMRGVGKSTVLAFSPTPAAPATRTP